MVMLVRKTRERWARALADPRQAGLTSPEAEAGFFTEALRTATLALDGYDAAMRQALVAMRTLAEAHPDDAALRAAIVAAQMALDGFYPDPAPDGAPAGAALRVTAVNAGDARGGNGELPMPFPLTGRAHG